MVGELLTGERWWGVTDRRAIVGEVIDRGAIVGELLTGGQWWEIY